MKIDPIYRFCRDTDFHRTTIFIHTILLFLLLINTEALAPPHQSWDTFESVYDMRRRLNITYNYHPKHINPEYCRYMTEERCRFEDQRIIDVIQEQNTVQKESDDTIKGPMAEYYDSIHNIPNTTHAIHRRTLERHFREKLRNKLRSLSYKRPRRLNTNIGTNIKVLVLLIKFKGHETRAVPPRTYYDELLNGDGVSATNPVGSLKEFLRISSLGKYRVVFDVRDWEVTTNTESGFAAGQSGLIGPTALQPLFTPVLSKLDAAGSIDWLDGYVDEQTWLVHHLLVIHSGYGAEFGQLNCLPTTVERDPRNRIWSQGSPTQGYSGWVSAGEWYINGYALSSGFDAAGCPKTGPFVAPGPAKVGMMAHEYTHGFGALDLYDQDKAEAQKIPIGGASKFSLMSNPFGFLGNAAKPGMLDPWSRVKVGWLTPIEITKNGFYSILPSEISAHVYVIKYNYPAGEYLMIENRQPLKWDGDFPSGDTGLLIWKVDEKAKEQTERGYPGHPNWPKEHYMVSLIQADGRYDIEKGANMGDATDFWKKDQLLGPGPNFPNTDSIQGGIQKETGIKITVMNNPSFIMSFKVEGFPNSLPGPSYPFDRTKTKVNGDPRSTRATLEWIMSMFLGAAAFLGFLILLI